MTKELLKKQKPKVVSKAAQPQPQPITFPCPTCRTKTQSPTWIKVAQTDSEYNLIKGQKYPFCSACSPKIKEFNEYDLITPELWAKYPYSDAKEILELEFGIQPKDKEEQK